jgi:hypothetical protein
MAGSRKITAFWGMAPCNRVEHRMMKAVRTSETSANLYENTQRYIPEGYLSSSGVTLFHKWREQIRLQPWFRSQ